MQHQYNVDSNFFLKCADLFNTLDPRMRDYFASHPFAFLRTMLEADQEFRAWKKSHPDKIWGKS